ncbi:MAG: rhodanese-like domain-containing protein [Patescibacteria group bacterium]
MIIDCRTKEEYNEGHHEGAMNISVQDIIRGELGVLATVPKDTEIRCYCASGARSGVAKQILESKGFTNIHNLGGF